MIIPIAALALLLQVSPPKGSIAGVALRSDTGEPVANAKVSLFRTDAPIPAAIAAILAIEGPPPGEATLPAEFLTAILAEAPPEIQALIAASTPANASLIPEAEMREISIGRGGAVSISTTAPIRTDSQGRFAFDNLAPGAYRVNFVANGFVRQDYGQKSPGMSTTPLALAAGQEMNLSMRMIPTAVVSGRIRDGSGQPIAGTGVQLVRFTYDAQGQRNPETVASTLTDDSGEYRLFFVPPGRYYLKALGVRPDSELDMILNLGAQPTVGNRIQENYPSSYYPGVEDANAASVVELQPGSDLSGMDLALDKQRSYRVRGRIFDSRTGQPPPNVGVSINPQNPGQNQPYNISASGPNYNRETGAFEFRDVGSGTYTVSASVNPTVTQTMTPEERNAAYQNRTSGSAPAVVSSADLDVGNISLASPSSIAGRIRMDQGEFPPTLPINIMRIQLRNSANASVGDASPAANAGGEFRINGVLPGEFRLRVAGLPQGFYVKSARYGDADVFNGTMRYSGPDTATFDVVISANVGQVDGVAANDQGQPVSGAQAVLIPEQGRERTELFKTAVAGADGRFSFKSVTPGNYKLVAWEMLEPYGYFDPEALKQGAEKGTAVLVTESGKVAARTIAIPAAQ